MDRVASECSAAVAHGTSRAVRTARQEVQGTRSSASAVLDWISVCPSAIEFWTHRAHPGTTVRSTFDAVAVGAVICANPKTRPAGKSLARPSWRIASL